MTVMTAPADPAIDRYPTRISSEIIMMKRQEPIVWGSPEDGPVTANDLANYGTNGFLAVSELLTPGEVGECLGELQRLNADPQVRADDRTMLELDGGEVRTVFDIHRMDGPLGKLASDPRLADRARQILGSDVYVHQSRISYRPGFSGKGFYWHSYFEAWRAQDGMPRMRATSLRLRPSNSHRTTAVRYFSGSRLSASSRSGRQSRLSSEGGAGGSGMALTCLSFACRRARTVRASNAVR